MSADADLRRAARLALRAARRLEERDPCGPARARWALRELAARAGPRLRLAARLARRRIAFPDGAATIRQVARAALAPRGPGRPPKAPEERNVRLQAYVPAALAERARGAAQARRMSVGQWVALAVELVLDLGGYGPRQKPQG